MKVIARINLEIARNMAEVEFGLVPAAHNRISQSRYESVFLSQVKALSVEKSSEEIAMLESCGLRYEKALYWKKVNKGTRRHPYYVTEFSEIPISEVGTKKNVVYIYES